MTRLIVEYHKKKEVTLKKEYKQELKGMALNSIKGAMPSNPITQDDKRGSMVVNTFLKTVNSTHKVYIYARLGTDKRDGAFLILVDPSEELKDTALKTSVHRGDTFRKAYKDKCHYAAMYDFGLDFETYQENCSLLNEYTAI